MDHKTGLQSRAQHHSELIAAGAICTSYDNLYIAALEDEHPDAGVDELLEALHQLSVEWDPEIHHCDNMAAEDLAMAAAEISRRLAGPIQDHPAQGGTLTDVRELAIGSRLDLGRIWAEYSTHPARAHAVSGAPVVVIADPGVDGGEVIVSTDAGPLLVPAGTLIPVIETPTKER